MSEILEHILSSVAEISSPRKEGLLQYKRYLDLAWVVSVEILGSSKFYSQHVLQSIGEINSWQK